jgi:hypothetical protein
MYEANHPDGSFWFAEEDFLRVRAEAEADLKRQGGQGSPGQIRDRLGMYMRHQFRFLLAVCRNWTPSFDGYVVLAVPPGGSVVALVGRVKEQPVYSRDFPGEAEARRAGLKLEGGLTQYVINFKFAANRPAQAWVGGRKPF